MSNPIKKRLSLSEFSEYVNSKDFGELPPTFLVIHHTYKPTTKSWKGINTINALDTYYRGLGWGGNGPHLFIAEDGIWLFTDMYDVGIHAGAGNGTLKTGYSIGIEVVGNYDNKVWEGETYQNTVGAIKVLMKRLGLKEKDIRFHNEFSAKTCPGKSITKSWVFNQLNNTMSKYYITSKLRDELKELWKDFNHDDKKSQEKMADKLDNFTDEVEKEKDILMNRLKTLIKDQDALNRAYDIDLEKQKNALTTKYNKNLEKLNKKLEVCEKLKDGALLLAEDGECKETIKLQDEVIKNLRLEINKQDLRIADLKKNEGIFERALNIISNFFKKINIKK